MQLSREVYFQKSMQMNFIATRCDVLSTLLSASTGAAFTAAKYPEKEAAVSKPSREEPHDFQPVRKQILQAIAQ